MAKTKEAKQNVVHETGDYKQMILKVDSDKHAWIKNIAEETGMTQPNVVNLILGQAIKTDAIEYINQIQKLNAKETLKKLDDEARTIEAERKRLTALLED